MKIEPNKIYMMPLVMGPILPEHPPGSVYGEAETVLLQYLTDTNAIQTLVPECFKMAEKPLVTVMFGYFSGVDFMAGRGYRLASVNVAVRFDGEKDHVEGDYILVMFEDDTLPILTGRDLHGVHKCFADVSTIKTLSNGHLCCQASMWGHLLFSIDLEPLKQQNFLVRSVAAKKISERPVFGYKYIPSLDGPPDVAYPTILRTDVKIEQLWMGSTGKIHFGDAGLEDIGVGKLVVDALKTLPVREVTQTIRFRGSQVIRNDTSRLR